MKYLVVKAHQKIFVVDRKFCNFFLVVSFACEALEVSSAAPKSR